MILVLSQLLCFHLYLSIKGVTTYEFITKNKVRPNRTKTLSIDNRPMTNDRVVLVDHNEQSVNSIHSAMPNEGASLNEPVADDQPLGHTGLSTAKKCVEAERVESHQDMDAHKSDRVESITKEMIIKPKPRRSGTELRYPL